MPIDKPGIRRDRVGIMKSNQGRGNGKRSTTRRGEGTRVGQPATLEKNPDAAETLSVGHGHGQIAPVTHTESNGAEPPFRTCLLEALRTADGEAAVRILGQAASTASSGDHLTR